VLPDHVGRDTFLVRRPGEQEREEVAECQDTDSM
jgi:hypothetical protein